MIIQSSGDLNDGDLWHWTVICPECQVYADIALSTKDLVASAQPRLLLEAERDRAVLEMKEAGCPHPVPPLGEQ